MSDRPEVLDVVPEASQAELGRRFLTVALGCLLVTSLSVSALMLLRRGAQELPTHAVRTLLLLLVGYALLQGRQWARWLLLALLVVGLWIMFPVVVRPEAYTRENLPAALAGLAMYVGYAVIARGLLWSDSVRAFFNAKNRPVDAQADRTSP